MSAASMQSKAFRARLQLPDHEIPILDKWCQRNCALHVIFAASDRGGRGTAIIGLRAVPQTSASFARTLRSALRKFGVSTAGLRGHWLFLITEREAISVCAANAEFPPEPRAPFERHPPPSPAAGDSEERVVELLR